jgi:hypothetical protein
MHRSWLHLCVSGMLAVMAAAFLPTAWAQQGAPVSCDEWLLPQRASKATKVGPQHCEMQELEFTFEGRRYRRVDMGLDGTVDGYLPKTGQYINYFTSAPALVFPAGMNAGPIYRGIATYKAATGAAMSIYYPSDRPWNGKMWVTVHGRGRSFKRGTLKAWDKNLDRDRPTADLDKYEVLMLSKGYALVKTHRTSETLGGDVQVTLEDGTFYSERNLNDNAQYILDFTLLAKRFVQKRLGRQPARTYFYGHSAGGRIGRALNYVPGLNVGPNGVRVFDGILADDSATGLWLPVVMKDGRDVLFATEAERAAFVPQLELSHQMYNAESPGEKAPWISSNYLLNKRENARLLRDKGLAGKHRMYEVRGVSHSGGETLREGKRGDIETLDLSKMMDRFIDMLDAWVDGGVAPPPTRSDWAELGDVDRDGEIEHAALAFPEVACPLGVYFQYPLSSGERGTGTTFFAAFTGEGLEPLDGRGMFADMNRNGTWDLRETPVQAWRRLGLLAPRDELTREKYVACVQDATTTLVKGGFFSEKTAGWYVQQAVIETLQPSSATTP